MNKKLIINAQVKILKILNLRFMTVLKNTIFIKQLKQRGFFLYNILPSNCIPKFTEIIHYNLPLFIYWICHKIGSKNFSVFFENIYPYRS